ncbi:MAG: hypothetical protein B2I17_00830 [Thermoplasmatales archaeon B_DKE]|nr:MAG: hypothetical protein B2I17_00830 [Thermoplasmatales archaeon B_DKE]
MCALESIIKGRRIERGYLGTELGSVEDMQLCIALRTPPLGHDCSCEVQGNQWKYELNNQGNNLILDASLLKF